MPMCWWRGGGGGAAGGAVGGAAGADEQEEAAGGAGADGGGGPVEAVVDLHDGRRGVGDDRLPGVRRVWAGRSRACGGGGERPGDEAGGGKAGDAVRDLHGGLL